MLLSNDIKSLPVDVDRIYQNNGIILFSETQAEELAMQELPSEFKDNRDIHAVTQIERHNGRTIFITIVKNRGRVIGNVRFSKAHELGHIFLNHFHDFELSSSSLSKDDGERWVLEREADVFAEELLAPTAILRACSCYDKESIKVLCNMSNEAAEYVIGDITRDYNVRERERVTLECQFDSFIRRKEYLLLISPEFCSVCGSPFSLNDSYCRMCGRHISSHATHEDSFLYPTTIHLRNSGRVYYCIKCGKTDLPISTHCDMCSAPLYNFCTGCQTKLLGDDRYCGICGCKSLFFQERLIDAWPLVRQQLNRKHRTRNLQLRNVKNWEYIIDKLLFTGRLNEYKALLGSSGYDDCGKLVILLSEERKYTINEENVLKEINSISLPYFDITYDDIEILYR